MQKLGTWSQLEHHIRGADTSHNDFNDLHNAATEWSNLAQGSVVKRGGSDPKTGVFLAGIVR